MKDLKGDIVYYTVTVLVETSNISSLTISGHSGSQLKLTALSRCHLIDYSAAQNLGSKTDFPDLTVVDSQSATRKR